MTGRPVARCLFSFSLFGRGFLGESGLHAVELRVSLKVVILCMNFLDLDMW